jgi:hypothetical protein
MDDNECWQKLVKFIGPSNESTYSDKRHGFVFIKNIVSDNDAVTVAVCTPNKWVHLTARIHTSGSASAIELKELLIKRYLEGKSIDDIEVLSHLQTGLSKSNPKYLSYRINGADPSKRRVRTAKDIEEFKKLVEHGLF